jgi:hypothetical protein
VRACECYDSCCLLNRLFIKGLPKSDPRHKQILKDLFAKLKEKDPDFNYQVLYTAANFSGFLFQTGDRLPILTPPTAGWLPIITRACGTCAYHA